MTTVVLNMTDNVVSGFSNLTRKQCFLLFQKCTSQSDLDICSLWNIRKVWWVFWKGGRRGSV